MSFEHRRHGLAAASAARHMPAPVHGNAAPWRRPVAQSRVISRLVVFTLLVLVLPVFFFFATTGEAVYFPLSWSHGAGPEVFLLLVLLAACLTHASHDAAFSLLRVPFYCFMYVFMCMVPCYQYYTDLYPSFFLLSVGQEDFDAAFRLVILSVACYAFGSYLASTGVVRPARVFKAQVRGDPIPGIAIALSALSLCIHFVWRGFEVDSFFVDRAQYFQGFEDDGSPSIATFMMVSSFTRAPSFMAVALLWMAWLRFVTIRDKRWFGIGLLFCIPVCLLLNFPTAVPRLWLGGMILFFSSTWLFARSRNPGTTFLAIILASLLVVFPLAGLLGSYPLLYDEHDLGEVIVGSYTEGHFDAFMMLISIRHYVELFDFTYGWQALSALLFWVPRSIFEDKGVSTGAFVAEGLGFPFTNLSSPLIGEMYIDFGLVGMTLAMLAYGALSRRIEIRFQTERFGLTTLILVAFLSGWQMIFLRGALLVSLSFLVPFMILCGVVAIWLHSRRFDPVRAG